MCALLIKQVHIMRTNIEIDDALDGQAMKAGPYTTKKDAVEAGLKLLARQAAYREILKWEGQVALGRRRVHRLGAAEARRVEWHPAVLAQEPAPGRRRARR
jgi:Arc/MetJ family transcription regulator